MIYILCNETSRDLYRKVVEAIAPFGDRRPRYVCDRAQLRKMCAGGAPPRLIFIEASLTWDGNLLQGFSGIDIASELRRDYQVKCPILFTSPLKQTYFEKLLPTHSKYGLLKATGTYLIPLPCSRDALEKLLPVVESLDDDALREVVLRHCGLQEQWQLTSHRLGGYLSDYQARRAEIRQLVAKWAPSICRFAPDQKNNLATLQNLIDAPVRDIDISALRRALETLDDGLQNVGADIIPIQENVNQFPRLPPKGYKKVLIADDEPQAFLLNSLRTQYGYDVVRQAYKLSQAKELLDKEKPDVVLSDYYFKESSRESEIPDKAVGDKFIKYALTHPQYADTPPKKPIVLVTSKATLRAETDIRVGAINCSGVRRSTNPAYIHNVIWTEARKWGVTQPEVPLGREWTLEYSCRRRLEQYKEDLPKLIKQWGKFRTTVRDTIRLCHLLSHSRENDAPQITRQLIGVLEPYESVEALSLDAVDDLFAEIEAVHKAARAAPTSEGKEAIRNILHGRIEQFSSVTNAVKFLLNILSEVARDLSSLTGYQHLGHGLSNALDRDSGSEPLLSVLQVLHEKLLEVLMGLPEPELRPGNFSQGPSPRAAGLREVNVVVVEDNDFWRDIVLSAIEKTRSKLGEKFVISYQAFDNAADALTAIPSLSQSPFTGRSDRSGVKTVAIVDICLPVDRKHAKKIRTTLEGKTDQLEIPRSRYGLNLLRSLSGYEDNIPLIVFSTIDSIEDRRAIGHLGVADEDYLVKGIDDEDAIVRALIRKIEKRAKYVVEELEVEGGDSIFRINGILIPFSKELNKTFAAIYRTCRLTGRNVFSVADIISAREDSANEKSKRVIQDQIYRIRNLILDTLRANGVYVDVRDLIQTRRAADREEFSYQLNAEVMRLDDEGAYESDLEIYTSAVCKVLVVESNPSLLSQIVKSLEESKYEVRCATNVAGAVRAAEEFLPHVVILDLRIPYAEADARRRGTTEAEYGGVEAWRQIRMSLRSSTLGVVVLTADSDKNDLISQAVQAEIPVRNIISKREEGWRNLFLKKVSDESRRVFLGELADARRDIHEPIVEILDGSDLPNGLLKLVVNGKPFRMRVCQLAKVIGVLLTNPKTLVSYESVKRDIGSRESVTNSDLKNWPKRFKEIIRSQWLTEQAAADKKELAEIILESSGKGLRLNVQVIDTRVPSRREQQS
jgi:CheY-like chemotaxis protein